MNKVEFMALLITEGYDVIDEQGVIMVIAEKHIDVSVKIAGLAKKHGYTGSYGVRKKFEE